MAFSADAMKVLHPREVFSRFAEAGTRADGRAAGTARKIGLNTATLTTCDGSAVVRLGGTTVAAGVQAILSSAEQQPGAAAQVGLQISPASSSRFRRTGFVDPGTGRAACIAQMAANLLLLPSVLDVGQLVVDPTTTTSFRLEVDAVCTTFDGNIEDAALLAVVCAVATAVLPALRKRADGSWGLASGAAAEALPPVDVRPTRRVRLSCLPVPLSFACIRLAAAGAAAETADAHGSLLVVADPAADEEALSAGTVTAVVAVDLQGPRGAAAGTPSRLLLLNAAGEPLGERETLACAEAALAHASLRAAELRTAVEAEAATG